MTKVTELKSPGKFYKKYFWQLKWTQTVSSHFFFFFTNKNEIRILSTYMVYIWSLSSSVSCSVVSDSLHPMDCIPPDSSVHGILQSRIVEWVLIPFSRGYSPPRDWTQVSCTAGRFFTTWAAGRPSEALCSSSAMISVWCLQGPDKIFMYLLGCAAWLMES